MTSEAKQYAQRNRQGSDWFYHDKPAGAGKVEDEKPAEEPQQSEPEPNPDRVEDVQESAEDVGDSAVIPPIKLSDEPNGRSQMIKPKTDSNQWFKHDHADAQESKSPRACKEGEKYCKRDKTGSAASWFSHEHEEEGVATQRQPSAGGANAARMRSESEHWFNHEGAAEAGASPRVRGSGNRPISSDIHGVFHHQ